MFNKPEQYFGLNDTYNVFTKEYVPLVIENRKYKIPNKVNIQGEEWVSINIGYIQLQSTLPTEYQLEILDTNGSSVLQTLTLKEGVVGVDIKPNETECIWFNENGIRGNYYIHSNWLGKIFNIKRGLYVGTAVSADYFNNLYERDNIIRDEQEHFAGYYDNGKPVYYVAFSVSRNCFNIETIKNFNGYNIEYLIKYEYMGYNNQSGNYFYIGGNFEDRRFGWNYEKSNNNLVTFISSTFAVRAIVIYYTKTTDSRII